MNIYKRRRKAFINRQLTIAAAVTASCVALLVVCHAMTKTRAIASDMLRKVVDKLMSHGEDGGDGTNIVYEEDAGDSYEI